MEYLQSLFSIEKEIDQIRDEITYHSINISMYNYSLISEDYSTIFSTESIKDVISLHKNKILIFIKKCISELITIILEFFGLTTNNKKIFLMMGKTLDKYKKSLVKTFTDRNERKGPYNFSENPITLRNPYTLIQRSLSILSFLTLGVTADIDTIGALTINNKSKTEPSLQFTTPAEVEAFYKNLSILYAVTIKAFYITVVMMSAESFIIDSGFVGLKYYSNIENNVIAKNPEIIQREDTFTATAKSDEGVKKFIEHLLGAFGVNMKSDANDTLKQIVEIIQGDTNSNKEYTILDSWYKDDKTEKFKNVIDASGSVIKETLETLRDASDFEVNSNEAFEAIINILTKSKDLANLYKNINVSKELDKMKKALDKVNKYFGTLDELKLSAANDVYHMNSYIIVTTYMYNVAKSNLNKFIREMLRSIDSGLTEVKKLEATIA